MGSMEKNIANYAEPSARHQQFQATNPATGEVISEWFSVSTEHEIEAAAVKAEGAFREFKKVAPNLRASFLEGIGDEIIALGDTLIKKCMEETGLPEGRIIGERQRTVNQLKLFAGLVREGSWVNARIDTADPDRVPLPKSDLRQMQIPLGPVCVFEASNFPLAFSTAGGDTASALASGCTVVAKSHSNHPGTSSLVASAIQKAVRKTGMPDGTFTLLHGPGKDVGISLVTNPLMKAVGFTGSFSGGMALVEAASKRKEPIPVYAEMGSVNPVFVLPDACGTVGQDVAARLVDSITLGSGQFCTNPGLVILLNTDHLPDFLKAAQKRISGISGTPMLSSVIKRSYDKGVLDFTSAPAVNELAVGKDGGTPWQGTPRLLMTSFQGFMKNKELSEEVFGPCSLFVIAEDKKEIMELAKTLNGQLTATIHGTPLDLEQYSDLVEILEQKAGRIIVNGVPTGVEVSHSMVHGGPFPATSDSRSTSVGTLAIYRFTRPVCYQDFPEQLLPPALQNKNPLSLWRMINGTLVRDTVL
jgi:alpha-ketoglutaric semialdehyde dehydrogenase